jgi:4-hydroxy-2-oxoglutarate aldolase
VSHATSVLRRLRGVLAPVVTTFRRDEAMDLDAFAANLRAHLAAGLDGVVVAGSTGEAALLDDDERLRLVAMARAIVPDERLLLAGVGAESTRQTVRRCRQAADQGADAVLAVAPHYYTAAMATEALRVHYGRVADESPVPVVLYNIPKYMHFALDPELVAALAAHDNVVGIKDSSGNAALLGRYLEAQSDAFTVLTGSGGGLHSALQGGARGGILAVSLFAGELTREVADRAAVGDDEGAAAAQARLVPLAREIVGGLGVPGVKAALDRVGLRGGPPRRPLAPLDAPEVARVASLLDDAGVAAAGLAGDSVASAR